MVERFIAQRNGDWQRLEALVAHTRARQMRALSAAEIMELGTLYQRAVADLAVGRRDFAGDRVCLYLNQLVARAHAVVYRSEAGDWQRAGFFFRRGFPALFRETLPFIAIAFTIFIVAAVAGFASVLLVPDSAGYLTPETVLSSVQEQRMWTADIPPSSLSASLLMTNNIQVALIAFAGGILCGVLTFYVLVMNGLMLGAIAGICQTYGMSLPLWSFVAPHGIIELTVIFIAGGCGLRLGYAILHPGLHTRSEALRVATYQVVKLLFGCIPLLVLAGAIEGFVSPSALPAAAKLAVGAAGAVLLYGYLFLAGRNAPA